MARHGVEYKSVKQAALKLLSKGASPSVQKIRELLGTGSNTTIAEHLKCWRAEHATKKVHHLPESIPEELITTLETLWQTAMNHAEQHMTDIKIALETREEQLQQEKALTDKTIADLKSQIDELTNRIELQAQENTSLQTKLALADERLENQISDTNKIEQQHELRLKHLLDEKHQAIENIDQLQNKINKQQQELTAQSEKYKFTLQKERELQENSEKRWAQLIDQARSEVKSSQKKYEEKICSQTTQVKSLQNNLLKSQTKITALQTSLHHKSDQAEELKQQMSKLQAQYTAEVSKFAVIQAEWEASTNKKPAKKIEAIA